MTHKPRLIVTLEPALYSKIKALSKTHGTTLSLTVRDIIRDACGDIEEMGLAALAERRLRKSGKGRWLTHDQIWK